MTTLDTDDVLTALMLDPFTTTGECEREAAALSGVRLPVEAHYADAEDLADE